MCQPTIHRPIHRPIRMTTCPTRRAFKRTLQMVFEFLSVIIRAFGKLVAACGPLFLLVVFLTGLGASIFTALFIVRRLIGAAPGRFFRY